MRQILRFAVVVLLACACFPALSADDAVLLHYTFREGSGTTIHDQSGNGADGVIQGTVEWVNTPQGSALAFNGQDTYIECGSTSRFGTNNTGTMELWCNLEAHQGGLVSRTTGPGWSDHRLSLAFWTEGEMVKYLATVFGDGASVEREMIHERDAANAIPPLKRWSHVVLTFDKSSGRLYVDGRLMQRYTKAMTPEVEGVPLRIGRCEFGPLGNQFMKGMLDEVKLYDRAISAEEVLANFKQGAVKRSVDTSPVSMMQIQLTPVPDKGVLAVEAALQGIWPIERGTSLDVTVSPGKTPVKRIPLTPGMDSARTSLDMRGVPPGDYQVTAVPKTKNGRELPGRAVAKLTWSGPSPTFAPGSGVKILNNLVMELLSVKPGASGGEYSFTNPYDGWVYFSASVRAANAGTASVSLGTPDETLITLDGKGSGEAMRFLPEGRHVLRVRGEGGIRVDSLVVRAIPELQYTMFYPGPEYPTIYKYGPYDLDFHSKYTLPNINTLGTHRDVLLNDSYKPFFEAWKKQGRRLLVNAGLPADPNSKEHPYYDNVPVEISYEYWSQSLGITNPLTDGITIDEFGSGSDAQRYYGWGKAIDDIHRDGKNLGKTFYPYTQTGFFSGQASADFARAVIRNNGRILPEYYICERPTQAEADDAFEGTRLDLVGWERTIPGSTRHIIPAIGYMSITTTQSLNTDPAVDFKVFLDRAMYHMANDPAFFKLYGIQFYTDGYADEETVRWAARLMRHYAIEGKKNMLSKEYGFKYRPGLISNPDFEDGLTGWSVSPARASSVSFGSIKGLSQMQGRYPGVGNGNTHLLTKRSVLRPNKVFQEIKGLKPGRLYSVKMITGDRANIPNDKKLVETHAVSISIDNADLVPEKCFQQPSTWITKTGLNLHQKVFRAKGTTARLTISDWVDEENPGGPAGQEIIYNFIEVQPYFEE